MINRQTRSIVFLAALLLLPSPQLQAASGHDQCVILLHGLFRSALALKPMEWYLEREGYVVVNQGYPSLLYSIEDLADMAVNAGLQHCHALGLSRVHFVTHSLGGILVRQYSSRHPIPGLERVVMMGPPNQGSQVAQYYATLALPGPVPPAITELGVGEASVPRALGPVNFDLGVIAGNFRSTTWLPGFPDELSDGTVTVAEAVVPGMLDFLQMPVSHTFMIINPLVMQQVVHFLRHGEFQR